MSISQVGIAPSKLVTTQAELRFCEYIATAKTVLLWGLYGASGYVCYYAGMNVFFDIVNATMRHV